jgi:hypothetical protein
VTAFSGEFVHVAVAVNDHVNDHVNDNDHDQTGISGGDA